MNLAIDIGNTLAKMAVIEAGQVVDTFKFEGAGEAEVASVLESYPDVEAAVLVSPRDDVREIESFLKTHLKRYMRFDHTVAVPLKNCYRTPDTLGCDRLAAAVGANALYPATNVMIADFGTAITVDMVSAAGEFLGGNISPGAMTRFRALHDYTCSLPLRTLRQEETELLGRDTFSAIESGVINGIVYEIEGYIGRLSAQYPDLRIIFTGGDGNFFAKRVKNPIFATYDLVAYGLNRILEYNAE